MKSVSMLLALSKSILNGYKTFSIESCVSSKEFCSFLNKIRQDCEAANPVIIMDQAGVHVSVETLRHMESIGFRLEYLTAYSSPMNPVEFAWGLIK